MQIFSCSSDFHEIANCLDNKRLQKQKVEIVQILQTIKLGDKAKGWRLHPAVTMAKGHELFFIEYGLIIAEKCLSKGWKDTRIPILKELKNYFHDDKVPWYWGTEEFHSSHRQTLLFKNFAHYSSFGWTELPKYEYWWPKRIDKERELAEA